MQYFIILISIALVLFVSNKQNDLDEQLSQRFEQIEQMNIEYFKLVTFERKFGETNFRPLVLNYQKYIEENKK